MKLIYLIILIIFTALLCQQVYLLRKEENTPTYNKAIVHQTISKEAISHEQKILLISGSIIFFAVTILGLSFYISFCRAKRHGELMKQKNMIIKKNAESLDLLNKDISLQNQQLEEENRLKDKLIFIISHDLRHPLVNTKSILDLINLKLLNPEETESLLEQLENQYVRSLNMLDNLLFWIIGQIKETKIEYTLINVNQLVNTVIEEQRISIQHKHLSITNLICLSEEFYAEKEILRIIIRNLLMNAVSATLMQGLIYFSSEIKEDFIFITIKYAGIGMSEEEIKNINEHGYFTSKGTMNEKANGFGLMLVKDLIVQHKGELIIQSNTINGNLLTIKLNYLKSNNLT